jgi:O-antigen/teichoic acid export membrane protein
LVAAFFAPTIALANEFMGLWLGPGYELAQMIVVCFALAMMCHCISRPIDSYFLARAAHDRISMISLLLLLSNVVISVLFGWLFGLVGVLAGTVISNYLCQFMLKLYMYKQHSSASVASLLSKFLAANLIMIGLGAAGSWLVSVVPPAGWLMLFVYGGAIFALSLGINWLTLLTADMRELIFTTISSSLKSTLRPG